MASHQGLHKVVKTVRGKKGTAHRAYWVKNEAGPQKQSFLRKHGADIAGNLLGGAMLVGGVAMMVAGHRAAMRSNPLQGTGHRFKADHDTSLHLSPLAQYGATGKVPEMAASHPGIMRGMARQVAGSFHLPSSNGNHGESTHPHFGAGTADPRSHAHAKITGDASRALAADFALDRVIGRSRRR